MSSRKCPQCGLVNWASAASCKRCDLNFTDEEQAQAEGEFHGPAAEDPHQSQGHGGQWPQQPAQKNASLATASLVLGILSFMTMGLLGVGAIAAFIMGIVALKKARKMPAVYGGESFAIAGLVLSSISALMFAYVLLIAAIAIPNLLAARRAANEAGAIVTLRKIAAAEATFYSTKGGARRFATLRELAEEGMIESSISDGVKYGYRFELRVDTGSYEVTATPLTYGRTSSPGKRSFYISSQSGYVVRAADKKGMAANAYDPPVETAEDMYTRPGRRSLDNSDYAQEY